MIKKSAGLILCLSLAISVAGFARQTKLPELRLVVFPFVNETGEKSLYWMGEAFAIGLTDHFLAAGVSMVEPARRREAMVEAGLSNEEPVSLASALLLARGLGADAVIVGEVRLQKDHRIEISSQIIAADELLSDEPVTLQGAINDIYLLQQRLAAAVLPDARGKTGHAQNPPLDVLEDIPLSSFELYVKALSTTDPGQRLTLLDRALESNPSYAEALVERARLELEEGRAQDALLWLDRVKEEDMAFPERFWLVQGDTAAATGDRGSAIDLYRKALESRPSPVAHFRLASALAQQGKLMEAREEVEAGLSIDPNHPEGIELHEALAQSH